MTVLEIVNRVLRRLREDTVTTITETSYSALVGEFVADIHEELLEHEWSSMEHTVDVPVDAAQRVLDLSRTEANSGDVATTSRVPTTDSIIYFAKVFDDTSDTDGMPLFIVSPQEIECRYQEDRDQELTDPIWIAFRNHPDRDGLEATIYPPPLSARHIRIYAWTPEAPIDIDTDDNREVLVPARPIRLGALYLALNERGEELGEPGGVAERRYEESVGQALEADVNRKVQGGRYVAHRE